MPIIKLRAGKYMVPVHVDEGRDTMILKFGFNRALLTEIKSMEGSRWNPDNKYWSVKNNRRNKFQLDYLSGINVYAPYDQPLIQVSTSRTAYEHQLELASMAVTRKQMIWAAEMGTGKSLAAIIAMEHVCPKSAWYIGPKSGVRAFNMELAKWKSDYIPQRIMSYEQLVKEMKNWVPGTLAPQFIIFDESQRVKTPTAQRSQAAFALAEGSRTDWCGDNYIIMMTGTPAPKAPTDWFYQCEIACPGFIKEGDIHKFRNRLAIMQEDQNAITGATFNKIVGWRDSELRCEVCGKMKDDTVHDIWNLVSGTHTFIPCKNEVQYLYERLKGLVVVKFKADCLDLPDKVYEVVTLKPSPDTLQLARSLKNSGMGGAQLLVMLRELSDGFQYTEVETDELITCPKCRGDRIITVKVPATVVDTQLPNVEQTEYVDYEQPCDYCDGTGTINRKQRGADHIGTPKIERLLEDLEAHEDIGRLVVWAGFTESIDRIEELVRQQGWSTLRIDGRGYAARTSKGESIDTDRALKAMDLSQDDKSIERLCVIGNPKAGGLALTFTASPTAIYFSNDFSGEARMQSEDRIHRAGMDASRGAKIIDYIHLPSDMFVLQNLRKKKNLQTISLGELAEVMEQL